MSGDDALRLRQMLDAAREAIAFASGRTAEDLTRDRMLLLSLVKDIEIIGEAARHVSTETKARITGVPWLDVTGMRNQLTHGYFDWDTDEVWSTVSSDLPELVRGLEAVLSPKV